MNNDDRMPAQVLAAIRAHAPLCIPPELHDAIVSERVLFFVHGLNRNAQPDVLVAYVDTQLAGPRRRLQTWAEFLATVESQES